MMFSAKATANSETPLLRLPAEIRNLIWEFTLGGKIRDVVLLQKRRKFCIQEYIAVSRATFQRNSHALLSTCRQIYTETALLIFSTNTFRFTSRSTVDWTRHLFEVQKNAFHTVHFVLDCRHCTFPLGELPGLSGKVLPIGIFPNVKHVFVEITVHGEEHVWDLTIR